MADVHYFLKIEGIEGESIDDKNKGEIELRGFAFEETQKSAGEAGGGMVSGKVKMQDLVVRAECNKASPLLFLSCANGRQFKNATLTCKKATGQGGQDWYLKWTLEEVLISEYKHVGHVADATHDVNLSPIDACSGSVIIPLEEFHLAYRSIKMEYRPQKDDGSFDPAVSGCWDRKANKAC